LWGSRPDAKAVPEPDQRQDRPDDPEQRAIVLLKAADRDQHRRRDTEGQPKEEVGAHALSGV
jgi:hypothetical protein